MRSNKPFNRNILTFSQWSRRAYAVFASLGKLVRIGQLDFDTCKQALLKGNKSFMSISLLIENNELANDDCSIEELMPEFANDYLLALQACEKPIENNSRLRPLKYIQPMMNKYRHRLFYFQKN